VKEILTRFLTLIASLSFNQKIMIGTLLIGGTMATMFLLNHSREDYDVMFSNLDETDAAAVVQNLKTQGVPFQIAENGTTILVPRSKKEELRLGAFQEDLIKGEKTLGYGALGSLPFGMTDWQQQKYDQKIVSDEVVTTLEKIQGIKKARVILAQAEDSVFSSEKIEPKASVMLIVEPGYRLKSEQIRTVRNMVAHSVPGLKPENVALSDSMGNELSGDAVMSQSGVGGSEADVARSTFEKQKAKDILEMLTAIVGPNNAVVKVSATMNFDKTESKIKRFLPTGGDANAPSGIPVSVQQSSEVYDSGKKKGDSSKGGEPGVTSNVPNYAANTEDEKGNGKTSDYKNISTTTNYEVSSEEKTIVHAPGTIEKMSIAVVVNKVLTDDQSKEISQLVTSASGVDAGRGDVVTVSGLQFSMDTEEQEKNALDVLKQSNQKDLIVTLAQYLGMFALAGAALFVLYRLLNKPLEGIVLSGAGGNARSVENDVFELPREMESLLGTATLPSLEAKLDPEIEVMRESINAMVLKDPSEAARVLSSYLKDM
jgi:flagellar M-ring protein FliF